jgi:hypothetical protein
LIRWSARVATRVREAEAEETGDQIANYKLLEQIGEGGFGTVWVADQENQCGGAWR